MNTVENTLQIVKQKTFTFIRLDNYKLNLKLHKTFHVPEVIAPTHYSHGITDKLINCSNHIIVPTLYIKLEKIKSKSALKNLANFIKKEFLIDENIYIGFEILLHNQRNLFRLSDLLSELEEVIPNIYYLNLTLEAKPLDKNLLQGLEKLKNLHELEISKFYCYDLKSDTAFLDNLIEKINSLENLISLEFENCCLERRHLENIKNKNKILRLFVKNGNCIEPEDCDIFTEFENCKKLLVKLTRITEKNDFNSVINFNQIFNEMETTAINKIKEKLSQKDITKKAKTTAKRIIKGIISEKSFRFEVIAACNCVFYQLKPEIVFIKNFINYLKLCAKNKQKELKIFLYGYKADPSKIPPIVIGTNLEINRERGACVSTDFIIELFPFSSDAKCDSLGNLKEFIIENFRKVTFYIPFKEIEDSKNHEKDLKIDFIEFEVKDGKLELTNFQKNLYKHQKITFLAAVKAIEKTFSVSCQKILEDLELEQKIKQSNTDLQETFNIDYNELLNQDSENFSKVYHKLLIKPHEIKNLSITIPAEKILKELSTRLTIEKNLQSNLWWNTFWWDSLYQFVSQLKDAENLQKLELKIYSYENLMKKITECGDFIQNLRERLDIPLATPVTNVSALFSVLPKKRKLKSFTLTTVSNLIYGWFDLNNIENFYLDLEYFETIYDQPRKIVLLNNKNCNINLNIKFLTAMSLNASPIKRLKWDEIFLNLFLFPEVKTFKNVEIEMFKTPNKRLFNPQIRMSKDFVEALEKWLENHYVENLYIKNFLILDFEDFKALRKLYEMLMFKNVKNVEIQPDQT